VPNWKLGRFGLLLASLVALLVLTPFSELVNLEVSRARVLYSFVLLAAIHSLRGDPWAFRTGLLLMVAALLTSWLTHQFDLAPLVLADYALTASFLGLTAALILTNILTADRVTIDTMLGGLCVYLLFGVLWVSLYSALEYVMPGSFEMEGTAVSALTESRPEAHRYPELLYFSFVTLTTLGYGDVVPTNSMARALATGEAILGQVYLAVFVASLVGLHLAYRTRDSGP